MTRGQFNIGSEGEYMPPTPRGWPQRPTKYNSDTGRTRQEKGKSLFNNYHYIYIYTPCGQVAAHREQQFQLIQFQNNLPNTHSIPQLRFPISGALENSYGVESVYSCTYRQFRSIRIRFRVLSNNQRCLQFQVFPRQ